ncbi:cytochrome b/b6 domain-containing protein [Quatrionicoccus australiensis]|uniref:cytochrome b/b6 domain-containing protein n=1 Tax=Quatrionicoccus australiensis TaxID=138118 RepID=UPI001CF98CD9|nr:cytochrome b/b6 domain-containing protein [Quatrionicoccus australiensis]MCB4358848.1 cytochrome b/b6 domain-containing protein [Quatrionicoccus australiensis]
MSRQRVWDLPTRLFHWLLAAAIVTAVVTGQIGGELIEWHGRSGLFILGLVIFRVVWGFVGAPTARFANFVRGSAAIRAYLRGEWRGVGHNPLGALAVLALLALTTAQVFTGLFANDDITFQGPLAVLLSKEASDQSRGLHSLVFYGLLAIVGLHLAAIAFYTRVKKENLLKPMLTGWKDDVSVPPVEHPHSPLRSAVAFAVAALIASSTVYAASGGLLPAEPPPPPAAVAAPAW